MKDTLFCKYFFDTFATYEDFERATKGAIYTEEPCGQIKVCFIDKATIEDYWDYFVADIWKVNLNTLRIILKKAS